ncbi:MAG: phytoene/squalene synthase family protein [Salaquimonas sp.]|jgi:phytoene synthase|nr:phytoene/squalene synthase family protein [Salaquimonas sp.]
MTDAHLSHCLDLLRQADPDRYLACLWLRREWRGAVAALYAFNAEIARIPSLVSEQMPGEIRLQWWREVIEGKREAGDHPVAVELLRTIAKHNLPTLAFGTYLEARIFDLYHDPMPDQALFETYAGETASALLLLAAQCAQVEQDTALADACGNGGVVQTVIAVLRSLALHRRGKRCYVPKDMLAAAGLTVETWFDEAPDERHLDAIRALIGWGREHQVKSRAAIAKLDVDLRPVFLPLAPIEAMLDKAERIGLDLFDRPPDISPLRRQWVIGKAALSRGP